MQGITLENEYVRYTVGADGQSASFFDKTEQKERLSAEGSRAWMSVTKDGKAHNSTSVAYASKAGELTVGFGDSGVVARLKVKTKPHHFTFELTSLTGGEVTGMFLCLLPVRIEGLVGETVAVARDETFAVGVQAMNIKMEAGANKRAKDAIVWVRDFSQYGPLVGAKFALFGCPSARALETIGEIEVAEGLPHPMLAGRWGKVSPEATRSYLITNFSEQNIDEVLKYAQAGGFTYIYQPAPFETWGHWPLKKTDFPNGYAGLKAVVEKANRLGIKVGVHILSGGITTNDAYVTPVPDPRLEKYGTATLAADVDAQATMLLVRNPQGKFGATKIVQIGDELVQYEASSGENPTQLTGCGRGLYGTRAAAHAAGAAVATLVVNSYKGFVPEPESSLLDEMAERMAGIFNECNLNQISFDGWEWHGYNKGRYGMNRYLDAVARRLKVEFIADASGVSHYGWHYFTRMNWGELTQSARVDVDEYRARNCAFFERNLMPKALGWWRLGLAGLDWEATPLEDIEYLLAKAAGHGGCHAMTTAVQELKKHGRTDAVLAMVRAWDGARYANAFSDEQRTRLRQRGSDFHLEAAGEGKWALTAVAFSPSYWCRGKADDVSFSSSGIVRPGNRCKVENSFGEQPLRFQLRALPALDYDHAENIPLLPPAASDFVREPSLRKEAPTIQTASAELRGQPAIQLTAKNEANKPSHVTRLIYHFPKPINLARHRGLGLWVRGDGKGELLFVEIVSSRGSVRPFYVPVDFTGERYLEFPNGEMSLSLYYDYDWNNWTGFASWWVTLKGFDYGKVASVTVGFNSIPAKTEVSCAVGGLRALREVESALVNPRFTVGGQSVGFTVSLQPQQYLVCEGQAESLVYDANWRMLKSVAPDGPLPRIDAGEQTVEVTWDGSIGPRPWARVKLKSVGPTEVVTRK